MTIPDEISILKE
jgi:WD40 repeat protein